MNTIKIQEENIKIYKVKLSYFTDYLKRKYINSVVSLVDISGIISDHP